MRSRPPKPDWFTTTLTLILFGFLILMVVWGVMR